jgi:hypothetical protein
LARLQRDPDRSGRPLDAGRALRLAIAMYRSRRTVQERLGYHAYDRAIPVPEVFQVRSLATDELFDVDACNHHTLVDRASGDPEWALAVAKL